ncbi:MAG: hypothetical protein AB1405_10815 [Bdellovibrionota bacterium]
MEQQAQQRNKIEAGSYKQDIIDKAVRYGIGAGMWAYHKAEPRLRNWIEGHLSNNYNDQTGEFLGGDFNELIHRNYEKAFAHLWKSQTIAPYLGIEDASKADWAAANQGVIVANLEKEGVRVEPLKESIEQARSEEIRREFQESYTPAQRNAMVEIVSLIAHGEAYALYTSSTLLPMVKTTGAKLGMAMQVMEEAKHFYTLREMLNTIDHIRPLPTAGRLLFEAIASRRFYNKLFGMNVVLEGFATSMFSFFEHYPGLRHIFRGFHMDESRHSAFPQSYASQGHIPQRVSKDFRYQVMRLLMLSPAMPLINDYVPHFDNLGIDTFSFFGKTVAKVTRLAERSGFYLPWPREETLIGVNFFFNLYTKAMYPEKYTGFKDYTQVWKGEISRDMEERELDTYGRDVYGGLTDLIHKIKNRENASLTLRLQNKLISMFF